MKFKVEVTSTGKKIELDESELHIEQDGGDEREMGAELMYSATYEGDGFTVRWEFTEYPAGCLGSTIARHENCTTFHEPDFSDVVQSGPEDSE
ncbi:hypothetical protein ABQZ69_17980 [Xanthomonas sp. WHRI 8391]|uniref:hypothetical protein n=1 Tax=Xanthomonas TaxID=338 RepID=UPI001A2A72AE|nr:hypothetical protein [Xanthomonas hortorum]MBG3849750.1 hypothetical protein [Xanthomonas hortorum pv. carotae]UTS74294.1 hypothetical protein NMB96_05490 [Xanthomonas hortorum]